MIDDLFDLGFIETIHDGIFPFWDMDFVGIRITTELNSTCHTSFDLNIGVKSLRK